jgi:hypothetical protein
MTAIIADYKVRTKNIKITGAAKFIL